MGAVLVIALAGGVTVRTNVPLGPTQERPLKPSTTMKYVCPAITGRVTNEPLVSALEQPSVVPQPVVSSLHAMSLPPLHQPLRT